MSCCNKYIREQEIMDKLGVCILPVLMQDQQTKWNKEFAWGAQPLDTEHRGDNGFIALVGIIGNWPDGNITLSGRPFLINYHKEANTFQYAEMNPNIVVHRIIEALSKNNVIWSEEMRCEGGTTENLTRAICVHK